MRQLTAAHIDDDSYCRYTIQQDMDRIARSLREKHKDYKNSIPEDNITEYFIHEIDEAEDGMQHTEMSIIGRFLATKKAGRLLGQPCIS